MIGVKGDPIEWGGPVAKPVTKKTSRGSPVTSPATSSLSADAVYIALAHGDDEHRAWLREAVDALFEGRPVPVARVKPSVPLHAIAGKPCPICGHRVPSKLTGAERVKLSRLRLRVKQ